MLHVKKCRVLLKSLICLNYRATQNDEFIGWTFFFSFGSKHLSPRSLSARNLGNLVCCEGIVTKCKSIHFLFFHKGIVTKLLLIQSLGGPPHKIYWPRSTDIGRRSTKIDCDRLRLAGIDQDWPGSTEIDLDWPRSTEIGQVRPRLTCWFCSIHIVICLIEIVLDYFWIK